MVLKSQYMNKLANAAEYETQPQINKTQQKIIKHRKI